MNTELCQTCRFWEVFDEAAGMGDCHRYPPTVLSTSDYGDCETVEPIVHSTHWCGEWQEAKS